MISSLIKTVSPSLSAPKARSRKSARGEGVPPVAELYRYLQMGGWNDLREDDPWGLALCALILAVEPSATFERIADAMPFCEPGRPPEIERNYMLEALANLGYTTSSMTMEPQRFDQRLLPALFLPEKKRNRPCVLLRDAKMFDSAGNCIVPVPINAGLGEIVMVRPLTEDMDLTSRTARAITGLTWFRTSFMRFRPALIRMLAIGFMLNLLALATPLFTMAVYDRVISTNTAGVLPMLAAGAAAACAFEGLLRLIRSRQLSWLATRLDNIVSTKLFNQLMHMPPSLLEGAPVQAQIARLKAYESIRDFFSGPMFLSMVELPFTVMALATLAIIAGSLAVVPLVSVALYLGLFYILWRKVRVALRIAAKAGSARQRYVLDTLTRLEDIRASGLPDIWQDKYREVSGREAAAQLRLNWIGTVGETTANAITVLSAVAIIGFGVGMIWHGSISTGALIASMILVWRVLNPFYSLCTMVPRLDQLGNSIRQINQLMDLDTEERASRALAKPKTLQGQITFTNVGMRYGLGDPVFTNLNFQVQPGQIAAITGENGAGKSSLLKLTKGLYIAPAGSVRIDGLDVRQLDPLALRRRIAYVPQNPSFFAGTVEDNMRLANSRATTVEIEKALDRAAVLEDVRGFPKGLRTVIGGEEGIQLCSNTMMRMSLARSYLQGDASILLIDEMPNSLMSAPAGVNLLDSLAQNKGKRTVLMVTYHVDVLRQADQIIWLRPGENPLAGEKSLMLRHLQQGNW